MGLIPEGVLYYRSQIRYYSMRFDTHECQNAPMIMHDCSGHSTSQISTTELQRCPQLWLQQRRILSIAPSNAEFRRSTHFLWVKTSFVFDKIPLRDPGDWYSQRNVMIFDFFIFPYQQQASTVAEKILLFTITPRPWWDQRQISSHTPMQRWDQLIFMRPINTLSLVVTGIPVYRSRRSTISVRFPKFGTKKAIFIFHRLREVSSHSVYLQSVYIPQENQMKQSSVSTTFLQGMYKTWLPQRPLTLQHWSFILHQ